MNTANDSAVGFSEPCGILQDVHGHAYNSPRCVNTEPTWTCLLRSVEPASMAESYVVPAYLQGHGCLAAVLFTCMHFTDELQQLTSADVVRLFHADF